MTAKKNRPKMKNILIFCLFTIIFLTACVSSNTSNSKNTVNIDFSWIGYIVENEDTLISISNQFNVSVETIISINGENIRAGDILKIPSKEGAFYTTKAGDSVARISSFYNVPQEVIVYANNLKGGLNVGDILFLPGATEN